MTEKLKAIGQVKAWGGAEEEWKTYLKGPLLASINHNAGEYTWEIRPIVAPFYDPPYDSGAANSAAEARLAALEALDSLLVDCLESRQKPATKTMPNLEETYPILRHFSFEHLPPRLREMSQLFSELAWRVAGLGENTAEATVALRKLLEAKDCAVRSVVFL